MLQMLWKKYTNNRHLIIGPATIEGTLPEKIGISLSLSRATHTHIYKRVYLLWRRDFFNYSNLQNIDDRHTVEKCLNFSPSLCQQ